MKHYGRLFEILHNIDFEYILERDENRESDGIDLRDDFYIPDCFDFELEMAFYGRKCSVFEMLLALSIRVDDEIIGDPAEEHPEKFFIEMIENLGLGIFRGDRYRDEYVIEIVQKWMDRKFNKKGGGSPFPMKHDRRDQRKLEIWDQMNAYISENYYN